MPSLIASGHIAGLILLFTLFEMAAIAWLRRVKNWGPGCAKILPSLAAGDFLLLAWWLSAAHWAWAALSLAGALAAHGFDIVSRLNLEPRPSSPQTY